jgi:predicted HicB family RNase H-like nuclease
MPQPYLGLRKRATVRLSVPVFTAAAEECARRRWSMNTYVAYAVAEQLQRDAAQRAKVAS